MKARNIAFIVSVFPLLALCGCLEFPDGTDNAAKEKGIIYPCDANSECADGFVCHKSSLPGFTYGECAPFCDTNGNCPLGRTCQNDVCLRSGEGNSHCVHGTALSDNTCACEGGWVGQNCDECDKEKAYGTDCTAYGSVKDQDNNTYKTVIINGREWMAQNYRRQSVNTFAIPNNDKTNVAEYGLLYKWDTASQSNFCPEGWRLPTMAEFADLFTYAGGESQRVSDNLRAGSWNNGNDIYGFSALPAGDCFDATQNCSNFGELTFFLSSNDNGYSDGSFYGLRIDDGSKTVADSAHGFDKREFASVRCIKGDEEQHNTQCGNGIVEAGEDCDEGKENNGNDSSYCTNECKIKDGCRYDDNIRIFTCCGNGKVEGALKEQCDDGNYTDNDGCSSCIVDPGYGCVTDDKSGMSFCSPLCGNGTRDDGEDCDDGNATDGDGCDARCQIEPNYTCSEQPSICNCNESYYGPNGEKKCYGSLTDPRDDNHHYKTVVIGNQTWMAENMAYTGDNITCDTNTDFDEFVKNYGCLYSFDDAQKVCPQGWHLPTIEDFFTLKDSLGSGSYEVANKLMNWGTGTNTSGFSALPAGYNISPKKSHGFGEEADFWSSSTSTTLGGLIDIMKVKENYDFNTAEDLLTLAVPGSLLSVRCVKD